MGKAKGFFGEFKQFVMRGNVIDLAVGVIIGGAFQKIVSSLVDDIVMPAISLLTDGIDFSEWKVVLGEGETAATLNYGNFISAIINFLIMAFVIFCIVKALNKLSEKTAKKVEEAPAEPTTKVCPFCKSEIAIDATKCPHCTSEIK
ncbi:MAG: large-conductance mechanosensitive channel protein MscL [Clostridia bacterium]|nr:large-conductance mechanosensitive channel protein MscL [Clostridia bacterium]